MTTMDEKVGEEKRVGVPCLKASVWSLIGHHNGMKGEEGKREEEKVREKKYRVRGCNNLV